MRDSEIKHCQSWREHYYAAKEKYKYRRKSEDGSYVSGRQGQFKWIGTDFGSKLVHSGRVGTELRGRRARKMLRTWIKVYTAHRDFKSLKFSGGGSCMKQGRETTLEECIQIVRECIACGKNYGAVALKYQVSYQQGPVDKCLM